MSSTDAATSCDFVVVGGGPAGAVCALLLGQAGASVALVDRGFRTASAVELLSGRARRMLEGGIDGFAMEPQHAVETLEAAVHWRQALGSRTNSLLNPWGSGLSVDRRVLDATLQSAAGAVGVRFVRGKARPIGHTQSGTKVLIERNGHTEQLSAGRVVLATGRDPHLAVAGPFAARSCIVLMARVGSRRPEQALYVESTLDGWWYALPDPRGGLFAGFCTGTEVVRRREACLAQFWEERLHRTRLIAAALRPRCQVGRIRGRLGGPVGPAQVVARGCVAIGDAAFAPDPLSGEGIEFAVASAVEAARALSSQATDGQLTEYQDFVREYQARHRARRAELLPD